MAEDEIGVREAGRRIADLGITDDVRRGRTNREEARGGRDTDADDRYSRASDARREDDRPAPRKQRRDEPDDDRPAKRRRDDDEELPRQKRREEPDDDQDADADLLEPDEDDDDADPSTPDGEDGEDDFDEDDDADGDDRKQREELHKVKVNGEVLEVTTEELKAGYSRGKDYSRKTQALAEFNRGLVSNHAKVAQTYVANMQRDHAILQGVRNLLVGQIDDAEMQALRKSDPVAWQTARIDYQTRIEQVDAAIEHFRQQHERHRSDFENTSKQAQYATVKQETERLLEAIPDWLEGKNGKPNGAVRLANYLRGSGFKDAEFVDVIDHRMLTIADKARKYDALVARKNTDPQRVAKPVPKRVAPGRSHTASGKSGQDRQAKSDFARARDKLAKTGDMRDAGDAINALHRQAEKRFSRRRR